MVPWTSQIFKYTAFDSYFLFMKTWVCHCRPLHGKDWLRFEKRYDWFKDCGDKEVLKDSTAKLQHGAVGVSHQIIVGQSDVTLMCFVGVTSFRWQCLAGAKGTSVYEV